MATKTINLDSDVHAKLAADAQCNGKIPLYMMVAAYQRNWELTSAEQQLAAIRRIQVEEPNEAGEAKGTLDEACNAAQRAALDLDVTIDRLTADGRMSKKDRTIIRRKAKVLRDAACGVAVHANEPALSSA